MMATDPVCLPIVDEYNAKFTSKYREQKYHFCCNWRKKKFEEKPERFTRILTDICVDPGSCTRTATIVLLIPPFFNEIRCPEFDW